MGGAAWVSAAVAGTGCPVAGGCGGGACSCGCGSTLGVGMGGAAWVSAAVAGTGCPVAGGGDGACSCGGAACEGPAGGGFCSALISSTTERDPAVGGVSGVVDARGGGAGVGSSACCAGGAGAGAGVFPGAPSRAPPRGAASFRCPRSSSFLSCEKGTSGSGAPHDMQKTASGLFSVPHDGHSISR